MPDGLADPVVQRKECISCIAQSLVMALRRAHGRERDAWSSLAPARGTENKRNSQLPKRGGYAHGGECYVLDDVEGARRDKRLCLRQHFLHPT